MYAYIKGTVTGLGSDSVVLDNNGIGYRISVPGTLIDELSIGDERKLYTYFSVREDAMQLFGFLREDDLEVFRLLLGVSGIGPKGALGVLGVMDADDLRLAVLSDDVAAIAKAPGIGKKTAQKVILELRDKLDLEDALTKKSEHAAEKGDRSVPHIYKVLRQEAVKQCALDCIWVNVEEDLGIQGLRELKFAYHPEYLLRKFIATEREEP